MLTLLRQRDFSLLWFAGLISTTGNWTLSVALPFYVYQLTGSALATGLMFMARTLPGVLFGSPAGVFVDRWDRKWTMVVVNLLATFLVLLLLTAESTERLWVVYLVAFIESSIMQFFSPAEKALLPHLVADKHLVTANSLSALNVSLGMLIGPAIGGALMSANGLTSVVLFDSVSYLVAGAMILLISWLPDETSQKQVTTNPLRSSLSIWRDWFNGMKLVRQSRPITAVFVAAVMAMLGEGIIQALLVLLVRLLKGGAIEFGWLLTLRGLGGLLGGLIFGRIGTAMQPYRVFPWTLIGTGLLFLVLINYPLFMLALILLCLIGICAVGANVTSTTIIQNGASSNYLGRVFGLLGMISSLMILIGQGSASALADRWGVVVLLNLGGGLYGVSGLVPLVMQKTISGLRSDNATIVKI